MIRRFDGGGAPQRDTARVRQGLINWKLFGQGSRERTHTSPAPRRLDPPLKQLWSYQRPGADRVPARDPRGRLRRQQVRQRAGGAAAGPQGRSGTSASRAQRQGPADRRDRAGLRAGRGLRRLRERAPGRARRQPRRIAGSAELHAHLESSPLVIGGHALHRHRQDRPDRARRRRRQDPLAVQRARRRSRPAPATTTGRVYVADYRGAMFALDADDGKRSGGPTRAIAARRRAAASTPRRRSPSASVYAGPRRRHRLRLRRADRQGTPGPSRPATASTARPRSREVPGDAADRLHRLLRPPPLRARRAAAASELALRRRRAGARHRDRDRPHRLHLELPDRKSIGIDVRTHRKTFSLDSPGYTPMVSDGSNLYLVGYFTLHGLAPR